MVSSQWWTKTEVLKDEVRSTRVDTNVSPVSRKVSPPNETLESIDYRSSSVIKNETNEKKSNTPVLSLL